MHVTAAAFENHLSFIKFFTSDADLEIFKNGKWASFSLPSSYSSRRERQLRFRLKLITEVRSSHDKEKKKY